MAQIVFLDTNVILDYLEKRNRKVMDIVAQLLFFHQREKIILATSVFNIAELIDKEFEIHLIGNFVSERMSYDEILKRKNNKKLSREIATKNRRSIERKIKDFIFDNQIRILPFSFVNENETERDQESKTYDDLYSLIYEYQFSSQDALIIATALSNKVTYFLSNDGDIIGQINNNGLMDAYNLRDKNLREAFKNEVLDTLAEVLR